MCFTGADPSLKKLHELSKMCYRDALPKIESKQGTRAVIKQADFDSFEDNCTYQKMETFLRDLCTLRAALTVNFLSHLKGEDR